MKPHCPSFMRDLKESPTLGIKEWPQSPCLDNRFTVFGIEGFVRRLNLALGASVWDVEGHIEFSTSCVNRGPPASCAHPSSHPSSPLLPGAAFHLATGIQPTDKVKELCEGKSDICKGSLHLSWELLGEGLSAQRSGGDVTLDFHKGKSGLFLGR